MKPWQIGLLAVAALVLAGSLWMSLSGPKVPKPGQVIVADVETGELFSIDTSGRKIALLPAKHPETGERSLFPVKKNENGEWVITALLAPSFAKYEGEAAAVSDRSTLVVNAVGKSPKALD